MTGDVTNVIPLAAAKAKTLALFRSDKYRMPQPTWDEPVRAMIERELRRQKQIIRAVSPLRFKALSKVCKEVKQQGIPSRLVCAKLPDPFGCGVFLHPEASPLKPGEVVGIYSGRVKIVPQHAPDDSLYAFEPLSEILLTKEEQKRWDSKQAYHPRRFYSLQVDAENSGNFTRFINHSSQPNVRADLVKITRSDANLAESSLEVIYLVQKKILPGQQLLVSYDGDDDSYWSALDIQPIAVFPSTFAINSRIS